MPIIHQILSVKHRVLRETGKPPVQIYMTTFERDRLLRELHIMRELWHYQITLDGEKVAGIDIVIKDYHEAKH